MESEDQEKAEPQCCSGGENLGKIHIDQGISPEAEFCQVLFTNPVSTC